MSKASGGQVWLASYPKSGNTWMRLALTSLRNGGSAVDINDLPGDLGRVAADRADFDRLLSVDSSDLSPDEVMRLRPSFWELTQTFGRRSTIWKIHDAWEETDEGRPLFPPSFAAVVVYLVRDPRDVAISWANHLGCDVDSAIIKLAHKGYWAARRSDRLSRQLPQHYSSWSDHVESWLDRSGLDPLVIRYEDMAADLAGVLERVSTALGWPCPPSAADGAVAATRFERLREQEVRRGFTERPPGGGLFFRRGVAGGWRDSLSAAQAARIERDHRAVMTRLGYL